MTARLIRAEDDPIGRKRAAALRVRFDGTELEGEAGQTIAGVLMSNDILSWRTTSVDARPRGLFCGIGVCFDCIVTVNGERDVRACQRRACDGDAIDPQHDELPEVKE
ncbi:(2Fe-2S)-binding protein [Gulosibacter faecalis]|jgi:predicted molibdopterin-dependent oxidoreductase YjgC|uniref:(2Fe-2S)-binding protein n=1 Tax=Gulosibacter faecalis TaxID=272240 RepID=A0ABW5UW22_9MICO|nr:(2Fe-2S)-binding protein [Gulosibacter faecalis]